jgi:hypothetical protein
VAGSLLRRSNVAYTHDGRTRLVNQWPNWRIGSCGHYQIFAIVPGHQGSVTEDYIWQYFDKVFNPTLDLLRLPHNLRYPTQSLPGQMPVDAENLADYYANSSTADSNTLYSVTPEFQQALQSVLNRVNNDPNDSRFKTVFYALWVGQQFEYDTEENMQTSLAQEEMLVKLDTCFDSKIEVRGVVGLSL